jgi:hypothetical protein
MRLAGAKPSNLPLSPGYIFARQAVLRPGRRQRALSLGPQQLDLANPLVQNTASSVPVFAARLGQTCRSPTLRDRPTWDSNPKGAQTN